MQSPCRRTPGNYLQRLHTLDITTGAEMLGGPLTIKASYPGNGEEGSVGMQTFMPGQHAERAGLLLLNGIIYTMWTSHCDFQPYTGWSIAYNASTLAQAAVPNANSISAFACSKLAGVNS